LGEQNVSEESKSTDKSMSDESVDETNDIVSKLRTMLIETIPFEAKSDLMAEAFSLFQSNKDWIDATENFVNIKNRKMNSLVSEESLKTLNGAIE